MSVLLYIVGALAAATGAVTIAYGFSIELSFGNALIVAGTSAVVGGLIVIGLGGVVSQLQRIMDGLATRVPPRPTRMSEMFEGAGAPRAAGSAVPFPPKPKSAGPRPPQPAEPPAAAPAAPAAETPGEEHFAAAPTLPNPDQAPVEVKEAVSLSPFQPAAQPAPANTGEAAQTPSGSSAPAERERQSETGFAWRLPSVLSRPRPAAEPPPAPAEPGPPPPLPASSAFDAMWPAPGEAAKPKPAATPEAPEAPSPSPAAAGEPQAVAILKSGVVDGMGYTLYVDGSIEAELPQGVLRFASINDLRDYLEKSTQP